MRRLLASIMSVVMVISVVHFGAMDVIGENEPLTYPLNEILSVDDLSYVEQEGALVFTGNTVVGVDWSKLSTEAYTGSIKVVSDGGEISATAGGIDLSSVAGEVVFSIEENEEFWNGMTYDSNWGAYFSLEGKMYKRYPTSITLAELLDFPYTDIKFDTAELSLSDISVHGNDYSEGMWIVGLENVHSNKVKFTVNGGDMLSSVIANGVEIFDRSNTTGEYSIDVTPSVGKNTVNIAIATSTGRSLDTTLIYYIEPIAKITVGEVQYSGFYVSGNNYYMLENPELYVEIVGPETGFTAKVFHSDSEGNNHSDEGITLNKRADGYFDLPIFLNDPYVIHTLVVESECGLKYEGVILTAKMLQYDGIEIINDFTPNSQEWLSEMPPQGSIEVTSPSGINSVAISINGVDLSVEKQEDVFTVDLSGVAVSEDGIYNVTVKIADNLPSEITRNYQFRVDGTKPKYSSIGTNLGDAVEHNGKRCVDGSFELWVMFEDELSGITQITFNGGEYKNGSVLTIDKDVPSLAKFVVTDNVGHEYALTLAQVLAMAGYRYDNILFDIDTPSAGVSISPAEGTNGTTVDVDGTSWFDSIVDITVIAQDTTIKSAQIVLNGEDLGTLNVPTNGQIALKNKGIEGKNTIKVTACDALGKFQSFEQDFYIDQTNPNVGEIVIGALSGKEVSTATGTELWTNTGTTIKIPVDDGNGSGLSEVNIISDGNIIATLEGPIAIFEWNKEGIYKDLTLIVKDKVGHKVEVDLFALIPGGYEAIVIDTTEPLIELVYKAGTVHNGIEWFKDNFELLVRVTEVNSHTVKIDIDGVEQKEPIAVAGATTTYQVVTKIEGTGSATLNVRVEDAFGNVSEKTLVFGVDKEKPNKGTVKAVIEGTYGVLGGKTYVSGRIVVSGTPGDVGSGVAELDWYKDGMPFDARDGIIENGKYYLQAVDVVGNYIRIGLSDLIPGATDEVVFDNEAPTIATEYNPEPVVVGNKEWFGAAPTVHIVVSGENAVETTVLFNGTPGYNGFKKDITLKYDPATFEGDVVVDITSKDIAGNETTKRLEYSIDNTAPEKGTISVSCDGVIIGDTKYSKDGLTISGRPRDPETGISKVEIFVNGTSVYTTDGEIDLTIDAEGTYEDIKLYAYNMVGGVVEYDVVKLIDNALSKVVIDRTSPVMELTTPARVEYDGLTWYSSDVAITLKVNELNAYDVVATANGVDVAVEDKGNNTFEILSGITDTGKVELVVQVIDASGNSVKDSVTYGIDYDAPTVGKSKARVDGTWKVIEGVTYVSGVIQVVEQFSDKGTSVEKVEWYKNGTKVDISGEISISGEYKIVVTDKVGNTSEFLLSDLMSDITSNVVFDNERPEISISKGANVVEVSGVDWYADDPEIVVSISDLNSYRVSIKANGTELAEEVKGEYELTFVTSGSVDVTYVVEVEDRAGNVVKESYKYSVDRGVPTLGTVVFSCDGNTDGTVKYTSTGFSIKGSPEDTLSGIDTIELLKDGAVVFSSKDGSISYSFTEGGSYKDVKLVVKDRVGNTSEFDVIALIENGLKEVVIDSGAPVLSLSRPDGVEVGDKDWYSYDVPLTLVVEDENSYTVEVLVNGKKISATDKQNGSFEIMSGISKSGKVSVEIAVTDAAGNKSTVSDLYYLDYDKPTVGTFMASVDGIYQIFGEESFISGIVRFDGGFADLDSGIKSVVWYRGDTVISLSGTISEDGKYRVVITDMVGNTLELGLSEVSILTDTVVFDNDAPAIEIVGGSEVVKVEGKDWYAVDPEVTIKITDKYIQSVSITANGVDMQGGSEAEYTKVYQTSSSDTVTYTVKVVDKAGNSSENTYTYYVDKVAPDKGSIKFEVDGSHGEVEDVLYISGTLKLSGTANDSDSGVKTTTLLKDGVAIDWADTISEDGVYTVRVVDMVGNESVFSLSELSTYSSDKVSFDNDKPTVTIFDAQDVVKKGSVNWYAKAPTIRVEVVDKNMSRVQIYVDGSVVFDGLNADNAYEYIFTDTTSADHTIKVVAYDKPGNSSEDSYSFRIDMDSPDLSGLVGTAEGSKILSDGIFTNGEVVFSGEVVDALSGVELVRVFKDGSLYSEGQSFATITLDKESDSGMYSVEAVDAVGNTSTISLNKLLGSDVRLVIDKTDPLVKLLNPPTLLESDGKKWSTINEELCVGASDANIASVKVYANGSEILSKTESGEYFVNTDLPDGEIVITATVSDKAGNSVSKELFRYMKDSTAPVIGGANASTNYVQAKSGSVFFKDEFTVTVDCSDAGVGVSQILLNGNPVNEVFSISADGEHSVVIVDKLGNKTEVNSLQSLLSWPGNKVVIDGARPTIVLTAPSNGVDYWYNSYVNVSLSSQDSVGLDKIIVYANGREVSQYPIMDLGQTSFEVSIPTSGLTINERGGYDFKAVAYDNAMNESETMLSVYVDTTAPVIKKFVLNGLVSGSGNTESGNSGIYSFFFDGGGSVDVIASDTMPGSGLSAILTSVDGTNWTRHEVSQGIGEASVSIRIPADFKGTVYAKAIDRVANEGPVNNPDGLVSESSNTHVQSSRVNISIPDGHRLSANGTPLYSGDFSATFAIESPNAGIRVMTWGIGDDTLGTYTDFNGVNKTVDKNLIVSATGDLRITGNADEMVIWVKVVDNVGRMSESQKTVSIDKDAPVLQVEYDSESPSGYFNKSRTARIYVTDRNFDIKNAVFSGEVGSIAQWENSGDVWRTSVIFDSDSEYAWGISVSDLAGNAANSYESPKFTVDKTNPVMSVTWSKTVQSSHYNSARTATITVVEKNFSAERYAITGYDGTVSWKSEGNTHKAILEYSAEGSYLLSISGYDLAGNESNSYKGDAFVVDLSNPTAEVVGISNGVSYKGAVEFEVTVVDEYLDTERSYVKLKGRGHDDLPITGVLDQKGGKFEFDGFANTEDVDDIYTLELYFVDKAGNEFVKEVVFSVNRFGSRYSFTPEEMLGVYTSNPTDVVIEELNTDKLDKDSIRIVVYKDGSEMEVDKSMVRIEESDTGSKYLYKYIVNKDLFKEDGKYLIQVYSKSLDSTDYASVAEQYEFFVDRSAPNLIVSGIGTDGFYREFSRRLTIEVRDASGPESVEVLLNGKEVMVEYDNSIYSVVIPEGKGRQSIVVKVVDKAGNTSTYDIDDFMISSSMFVFLSNQWWFWAIIGLLGVGVIFLLIILLKRRKDEEEEEKQNAQISGSLFTTGSSSSSNSSSTGGSDSASISTEASDTAGAYDVGEEPTGVLADDSTNVLSEDSDENPTGIL